MEELDEYYKNPTKENREKVLQAFEETQIQEFKTVIELSKSVSLKNIILIASALQWDNENYCTSNQHKYYPAMERDLGYDTKMKLDTDNREFFSIMKKLLKK